MNRFINNNLKTFVSSNIKKRVLADEYPREKKKFHLKVHCIPIQHSYNRGFEKSAKNHCRLLSFHGRVHKNAPHQLIFIFVSKSFFYRECPTKNPIVQYFNRIYAFVFFQTFTVLLPLSLEILLRTCEGKGKTKTHRSEKMQ
jgi:hypothetical protein